MRAAALVVLIACSPEFALPQADPAGRPPLSVEPLGSLEAAPGVLRLRVLGGAGRSALADFRFFFGTLGTYHVGRIRSRDLPATLLEREVRVLVWADGRDVVVAPLEALTSGAYALATPEIGLVAELIVDAGLVPVVERLWPPRESTQGSGTALFCGDATHAVTDGPIELAPAAVPASVARGLDEVGAFSDRCVRVEPTSSPAAGVPLLPPALSGGAAFEPRLLVVTRATSEAPPCDGAEIPLGPLCGVVADDRVELRARASPAFVAFESPSRSIGVVRPERSLVLRGLKPSSSARLSGLVFDATGEKTVVDREIQTSSARSHVVLNEVLANSAGAEAKSEWIELVNDGSEPVELDGYVLDDALEPVALPAFSLAPGAFALLVAEGFAPDPELDLAPLADVALVVVPRLGRGGLSNAGELLRLRDASGAVISRFPARAAALPGTSVARRAPDSPDDETGSFGRHAAPGASPGWANVLEDEGD